MKETSLVEELKKTQLKEAPVTVYRHRRHCYFPSRTVQGLLVLDFSRENISK